MTQPPDDRPRPDQPAGDQAPENEPTVAWTPPESESEKPADEGGVGYAAMPDEAAGTPPPAEPTEPAPPPHAEPAPAEPPVAGEAPATSPIISAETSQPSAGWDTQAQQAGQPVPPPVAPGSGWTLPAAAVAAPEQEGYVIAGVGARFVAWLFDATLSSLVPIVLSFALIDFTGIIRDALRQAELNPTGQLPTNAYSIPVTLDYVLVTLIGLGIQFLYFVGFWTSRWRATPGMIGLKMRVVDAASGGTMSILDASKRWVALGFPLTLLGLVPVLQSAAGLIQFALLLFIFFTIVTNDRRQGLHDRWANSLVIRHVSSGNGATIAGCLLWGILIILLIFVASTLFLAAAMPAIQEYIESLPSNAT